MNTDKPPPRTRRLLDRLDEALWVADRLGISDAELLAAIERRLMAPIERERARRAATREVSER